jgi:hypothetical protein
MCLCMYRLSALFKGSIRMEALYSQHVSLNSIQLMMMVGSHFGGTTDEEKKNTTNFSTRLCTEQQRSTHTLIYMKACKKFSRNIFHNTNEKFFIPRLCDDDVDAMVEGWKVFFLFFHIGTRSLNPSQNQRVHVEHAGLSNHVCLFKNRISPMVCSEMNVFIFWRADKL